LLLADALLFCLLHFVNGCQSEPARMFAAALLQHVRRNLCWFGRLLGIQIQVRRPLWHVFDRCYSVTYATSPRCRDPLDELVGNTVTRKPASVLGDLLSQCSISIFARLWQNTAVPILTPQFVSIFSSSPPVNVLFCRLCEVQRCVTVSLGLSSSRPESSNAFSSAFELHTGTSECTLPFSRVIRPPRAKLFSDAAVTTRFLQVARKGISKEFCYHVCLGSRPFKTKMPTDY